LSRQERVDHFGKPVPALLAGYPRRVTGQLALKPFDIGDTDAMGEKSEQGGVIGGVPGKNGLLFDFIKVFV